MEAIVTRKCRKCGGTGDYNSSHICGACSACGGFGKTFHVNTKIKGLLVDLDIAVRGDLVEYGSHDAKNVYRVAIRAPYQEKPCSCVCHASRFARAEGCLDCHWDHNHGAYNETLYLEAFAGAPLVRYDRQVAKPVAKVYAVEGAELPAPVAAEALGFSLI